MKKHKDHILIFGLILAFFLITDFVQVPFVALDFPSGVLVDFKPEISHLTGLIRFILSAQ
jgi:hypothetical protein